MLALLISFVPAIPLHQVRAKYNTLMLDVFRETFNWLPLAFCLNRKVLVLHGGLFSTDKVTLDDLRQVGVPSAHGLLRACTYCSLSVRY